jgi:cytochrome c2
MRNASLEILEYLTFFLTSLGFWSIVMATGRGARLGYGARLLFLTTAAVLTDLPGALMVFAPQPLYPEHANGVHEWGLTLMQDQQIAGLIMWVPGGIVFVCVAGALFVAWLREAERRALAFTNQSTLAIALVCCCLSLLACSRSNSEPAVNFGGDAGRGKQLIDKYGCGSCHVIPDIADGKGNVGPPLTHIGSRTYIAGVLRNSPDNLSLWISHPQQIVPGNAMPDMHISAEDAHDITAFLYTLK